MSFNAASKASTLSLSVASSPAKRAERTPGRPSRASTARPLSSASAGRPVAFAAWRALIMAFSTKVTAGSSASDTPSSPWGTGTKPSGASRSVSSATLPLLLLAMTSFRVMVSVIKQGMGKTDRQIFLVAAGARRDVERHQISGLILVLGNEVHGITFLNAPERQEFHLLDIVGDLAFHLPADGLNLAMLVFGHDRDVDDADAPAALQVVGLCHFRRQEGAGEYTPVHLILSEILLSGLAGDRYQHKPERQDECFTCSQKVHHVVSRVMR